MFIPYSLNDEISGIQKFFLPPYGSIREYGPFRNLATSFTGSPNPLPKRNLATFWIAYKFGVVRRGSSAIE